MGHISSLSWIKFLSLRMSNKRILTFTIYYSLSTAKMTAWSTEEEIVVIYYASRRIKSGTIEELIAKKCHPKVRSIKQIAHKSSRLKKACAKRRSGMVNPFLAPDREWNRKLADQWIVSKMEKAELDQLLEFDGETAAIIGEASGLGELSTGFRVLTSR